MVQAIVDGLHIDRGNQHFCISAGQISKPAADTVEQAPMQGASQ